MRTFAHKPESNHNTKSTMLTKSGSAFTRQSREVSSILHLHRTIGNQAVQRLLQNNAQELEIGSTTTASTRFAHNFSGIPLYAKARTEIQPKLRVSTPGDRYEQEADRIADEVLRQKMPVEEKDQKVEIQARASQQAAGGDREVNEDLENRLSRSKGGGNSISNQVRHFFEPRMQFDLSKVRVHTDSEAAWMNQELRARAFTHGRDIYFGDGQYNPQSIAGKRLLTHELTHVVQQEHSVKSNMLHRWQLGTGTPPDQQLSEITDPNEIANIGAGMMLIVPIATREAGDNNLPAGSVDTTSSEYQCYNRFRTPRCGTPSPGPLELHDHWQNAVLWKYTGSAHGLSIAPHDIGFPPWILRWGARHIAATAIHEYGHLCGNHHEGYLERTVRICGFPTVFNL